MATFPTHISKLIFMYDNRWIVMQILLNYNSNASVDEPASNQLIACRKAIFSINDGLP